MYDIEYAERAIVDLESLRAFDRRRIVEAVQLHLAHEPKRESKSRIKEMTQPFWSHYRLRVNEFRVYYDVVEDSRMVNILRVLEKGTRQTPEVSP